MESANQPPQPVRRARGLRRMGAILDAAETCFARMGFSDATTNHIAAEAEISPGSLYQFFDNKEAIAHALATRYNEELERVYLAAFTGAGIPLAHWLDQVIDTLLAFHDAHPAFHVLLNRPPSTAVAALTQDLPNELQRQFERGIHLLAPTLPAAQASLSAILCTQLFRAMLPRILAEGADQRLILVAELKTALGRYLEPLLG